MHEDAPIYLRADEGEAFLAVLHRPGATPTGTAVLIVPPFGYDHLCAYRSLRAWATQLAAAGHAVLRYDPPATGDSAGAPEDGDVVGRWVRTAAAGARWLRSESGGGARRVVAAGLGLGGLIALEAVRTGAPIDDLVLWGAPARGRGYLRELRMFSRLGVAAGDPDYAWPASMPPLPEGSLEAGGFLMAPETVAALGALDATAAPLPGAERRRVLLLTRDDIGVDAKLEAALRDGGAEVTVATGAGWSAMLDSPHLAVPPLEVFATSVAWLAEPAPPAPEPADAAPPPPVVEQLDTLDLGAVVERPLHFETPHGRAFAILSEPAPGGAPRAARTAVLLNSGAERRIGANRLWTDVARRWAARGVPTLRIDVVGVGDADGPDTLAGAPGGFLYDASFLEQLRAVIDGAAALGLPDRFVVSGICSGAYWSFQLAVADARVRLALPFNARLLLFDSELAIEEERMDQREATAPPTRETARAATAPSRAATARRQAMALAQHPRLEPARAAARHPAARAVIRRVWGLTNRGDDLDRTLDLLRDRGQAVILRCSAGEPLYRELDRENRLARARRRWPGFTAQVMDGPPGTHTLQVVRMLPYVNALLDASLDDELAR